MHTASIDNSRTVHEIEYDVPCAGCGYNLRSLAYSARCVECDLPIEKSMLPSRLCFSDLVWLRSIRLGIVIAFIGFAGWAAILAAYILQFISFTSPFTYTAPGWTGRVYLIDLFAYPCALVAGAGVWIATQEEPGKHNSGRLCKLARVSCIVAAAPFILGTIYLIWTPFVLHDVLLKVAAIVLMFVPVQAYYVALVARMPRRRTAKALRVLLALQALCLTGLATTWIVLNHVIGWQGTSIWLRDAPANLAIYFAIFFAIAHALTWRSLSQARRDAINIGSSG